MRPFRLIPFLAWSLVLVAPPAAARLEILRSDESGLEMRWIGDRPSLVTVPGEDRPLRRPEIEEGAHLALPGQPDLPSVVRLLGIPDGPRPRIRIVSITTDAFPLPDLAPAPFSIVEGEGRAATGAEIRRSAAFAPDVTPAAWVELGGESWIRGQRVAQLAIHPCRYDGGAGRLEWARELVFRVEYPEITRNRATGPTRPDQPEWESVADDLLLNADVARAWRRPRESAPTMARGTEPSFDSAPVWVRVPITESGLYRLDYYTFANLGIDPGAIDPRTVRVFAGRNLPLPENLNTSPPDGFMTECALKDLGDGNDRFDPTDVFLFYALGPDGWANEYDPSRSRFEYVENKHASETWYWITWGGSFPSSDGRRMSMRSVPDGTATSWASSAPHRIHVEQNNLEKFNYRDEDGWVWEDLNGRGNDRRYDIAVPTPESGDGFIQARLYSHGSTNVPAQNQRTVELKLAGSVTTRWEWTHGQQSAEQTVTGCFTGLLAAGPNAFLLDAEIGEGTASDNIYTGWFDVEYDRRLSAEHGWLKFFSDPDAPVLPAPPSGTGCAGLPPGLVYGHRAFRLLDFDARPSEIFLFDVTDQHDVVELTDFSVQNPSAPYNIRFSDPTAPGIRWYVAVTLGAARPLPAGRIATLRGLRNVSNGAEYLVITHPDLRAGAERLAAVRDARAGRSSAVVVDVADVYQEFSWGMKDPVAIRDFLHYTQDRWSQGAPLYVALIGDAVFDTKGYLSGSAPDLMPTYTERYRESSAEYIITENVDFYSTDDFFAYLDAGDYTPPAQPAVDIAIGRYPVRDPAQFDIMLDKLDSYYAYRMPGQWQNRVLLVADDERVLDETTREPFHTTQVEAVATERVPPALDKVKVYLVNYPRDPFGKKPEAQRAFIDEFTRGALMTSYTGHGDQNTMAQEEVFVAQKISELLNEERTTVFSTFSCTVSRFDLISGSSMAELLLDHEEGGAVGTFASGGLVFPTPSWELHKEWLGEMFGTPYVIWTYARSVRSLGLAALTAKGVLGAGNTPVRKNNEKYVLLGDPALEVRFGRHLVEFDSSTVDSVATQGLLRRVTGRIVDENGATLDGTNGTVPFDGTAFVHVTENADTTGADYTDFFGNPFHIPFVMEGPTAFRGEVPVESGRFEALFYLNEGVNAGNSARVSVFALEEGPGRDASGAYDSLRIAPTISPSQVDDREGPRITIRFEGYDRFIDGDQVFTDKPVILVTLEDPSGINLRPFPQYARLEAEIDGRNRIDLVDDFSYRDGFTSGTVRRIVPLAAGQHTLEIKAFDNVNNRSTQAVRFEIVLPGDAFDLVDRNVGTYPNPFRERVDFLYRLTHDADVEIKVFTITGRKIREFRTAGVGGDNVLSWDGRDENGLPVANGTYLFKLEAARLDENGDLESDEYVGKVVRIR